MTARQMMHIAGLSGAMSLGSVAIAADIPILDSTIATGTNNIRSVFVADIDQDGDLDVATASFNVDTISWLENNGAYPPVFTENIVTTGRDEARTVFVTDVNGDGDPDLVVVSSGDNTVAWYESNGDINPSFTEHLVSQSAGGPFGVFADDLDGDGDVDIAVGADGGNTVQWYESDGADPPVFTEQVIGASVGGASNVFITDVDGDGDNDILVAVSGDNELLWYENDGAIDPMFTEQLIASENGCRGLFAADMDGDGDMDIITGTTGSDRVTWHENDGAADPMFTQHLLRNGNVNIQSVFAADLDADGDTDVLAALVNNRVLWYDNDGADSPAFTERTLTLSPNTPVALFVADMDNDDDADVVTAARDGNSVELHENLTFMPLASDVINLTSGLEYSNIAGAISAASDGDVIQAETSAFDVAEIDFVSKEVTLIAKGGISRADTLYTLSDDGLLSVTGSLANPARAQAVGAATVVLEAASPIADEIGSLSVPVADGAFIHAAQLSIAQTGTVDLETGSRLFGTMPEGTTIGAPMQLAPFSIGSFGGPLTLGGQFAPEFTKLVISNTADSAFSVYATDVDGDGDTDVLSASDLDDTIAWYENDGMMPPGFTTHIITNSANGAFSVYATDVDGDGDTDVLSASYFDDTIAWYENDGMMPPNFTRRVITNTADYARGVYATDVDGDGDTDVLSASSNDGTIAWYENDGMTPPGFTTHIITDSANGAASVYATDVDGDGDTDVLSASVNNSTIAWYENDGMTPPGFTTHTISNTAAGAISVYATDVDGDGDTDVLSATFFDDTIAWYENDGMMPPNFTRRIITNTADFAFSVYATDVDGDGDTDVLSASTDDDTIAWYRNDAAITGPVSLSSGALLATDLDMHNEVSLSLFDASLLAAGGLTNAGTISGFGNFDADVTNDNEVLVQADTQVAGDYTNYGTTTIQNGTLTILGALTDNGIIIGDFNPLTASPGIEGLFASDGYTAGAGATLAFANGGMVTTGGDFDAAIDSNTRFDLVSAMLKLNGVGGAQSLEVMSVDIGPDPDGQDRTMAGHYPLGGLRIGPTATTVNLVDNHDNANDGQTACEAIYVSHLTIDAGATLNTIGCKVYYETLTNNGTVDNLGNLIPIAPDCPGDGNGDLVIDVNDLNLVLGNFGESAAPGIPGDINGSGTVDINDLNLVLGNFGESCV